MIHANTKHEELTFASIFKSLTSVVLWMGLNITLNLVNKYLFQVQVWPHQFGKCIMFVFMISTLSFHSSLLLLVPCSRSLAVQYVCSCFEWALSPHRLY